MEWLIAKPRYSESRGCSLRRKIFFWASIRWRKLRFISSRSVPLSANRVLTTPAVASTNHRDFHSTGPYKERAKEIFSSASNSRSCCRARGNGGGFGGRQDGLVYPRLSGSDSN